MIPNGGFRSTGLVFLLKISDPNINRVGSYGDSLEGSQPETAPGIPERRLVL